MKDILSEIIAHKQTEIELQKQTVSPEQLQEQAGIIIRENAAHHRSMKQALAASSTGIISEFKRRSPSKGWINEAAQAEEIPASYEAAGAAALSILTDEKFFGGTLRDMLLGLPPFWMQNVSYLVVSGFAFLFVVGLRKYVIRLNNTFFIFDAVGLGLFTVVGIQKSIAVGYPMWVGIIMGTLTGAAGGMLRDVLLNEVPLIFRKDIYAIACICGGLIYYLCMYLDLPAAPTQFIAACSVILIRILAVRYGISLPALKGETRPAPKGK